MTVTITWDNAGSPEETVVTATADINAGEEEADLSVSATQSGWAFVSRSVELTLVAYFRNGVSSAATNLSACPISEPPEPAETLSGVATTGNYPIADWARDGYELGIYASYQAPGHPLWVMGIDMVTGEAVIQFGSYILLIRSSGSPYSAARTYVSQADAKTEYNGGNPWNYMVS